MEYDNRFMENISFSRENEQIEGCVSEIKSLKSVIACSVAERQEQLVGRMKMEERLKSMSIKIE